MFGLGPRKHGEGDGDESHSGPGRVNPPPSLGSIPTFNPSPSLGSAPTFNPSPTLQSVPTFNPSPKVQPVPTFNPPPSLGPGPTFSAAPPLEPEPTFSASSPILGSLPGFVPFSQPTGMSSTTGSGGIGPTFTVTGPIQTGSSGSPSVTINPIQPIPTSPPSSPPPVLAWSFEPPINATTCEPFTITWDLANSTATNLMAANVMSLYCVGNIDEQNAVNLTMASNVPLAEKSFTWSAVIVPPGSYVVQGIQSQDNSTLETSSPFSVQAGSNTSCLIQGGSSSGGSANNNGHPTKTAAIAGGVVGGLVFLACLAMAILFIRTMRQKRRPKRARRARGGWGGLDSVDYKPATSLDYKPHSSRVELNTGEAQISALGAGSPMSVGSAASLEGEKVVAAVAPVESMEPGFAYGSPASVELAHLSSSSRSHRSSMDTGRESVVSTPTPVANPRRTSRTPRKAVPAYEPTPEEWNELAMARSHSARSTASQLTSSYMQNTSTSTTITSTAPTPLAHYQHQHSSSVSQHGEALFQGLKSKSSGHFDNQPMHYLIPDPPPPSRE